MKLFRDRSEAGRMLAKDLLRYAGRDDVVVLALPRGGAPVAYEIAKVLKAPLDLFIVRKLGVPGREELAMGAVASGGVRVINEDVVRWCRVSQSAIEAVTKTERQELERRERAYRGGRPMPELANKTVILVDDGLATGTCMLAAIRALRTYKPARIIAAVPTGPAETCRELQGEAETVVCATTPEPFWAIGAWYEDFRQTTDEEVQSILARGCCRAAA